MNGGRMLVFSIWSSSFSLQTVVCFVEVNKCQYGAFHRALLESIFDCINCSSDLIFTALSFTKTILEETENMLLVSAIWCRLSARIRSRSLMTLEVRLTGWKEATLLGDFLALSSGMIVATLLIRWQSATENNELNMDNNSWRAKGPSD